MLAPVQSLFDQSTLTDRAERLVKAASVLSDPKRGWFAGLYEHNGKPNTAVSANTNAVVLESLAYTQRGPLLAPR